MLNFDRGNRTPPSKDPVKPGIKPAMYDPPAAPGAGLGGTAARAMPPAGNPPPSAIPAAPATRDATPATAAPVASRGVDAESRLAIGVGIKLKGVEISDCDVLVIEGHVEATIHSKTMEIHEPGTFKGNALIDVAEVHGEFIGELTARTRLVVHGTGRVSGTIRYGKLVVEEGGEVTGDIQRITERDAGGKATPANDSSRVLASAGQAD